MFCGEMTSATGASFRAKGLRSHRAQKIAVSGDPPHRALTATFAEIQGFVKAPAERAS